MEAVADNYDFYCPECNKLGSIDEEQQLGQVSIICSRCGWHGYKQKENEG